MTTYEHGGKQYVAILSGVGGWAGIGLAAGLTDQTAGLGAVGGYAALKNYTSLGGQLTVFALATAPSAARPGAPKGSTKRESMKNLPKGTVCRRACAFLHGSRDHVPM